MFDCMIARVEVDEIENIQKEVENNAIDLNSVGERSILIFKLNAIVVSQEHLKHNLETLA